jgi:diguanylate cyclase (GGDEF)-like protein/PAS domain S-box-containing protein
MSSPDLYLRRVLDGALDAVLEISPDGIITSWNDAAARLLGWSPEEAVGERFDSLALAPGHWPAVRQAIGQRTELMLRGRDGGEVPVDVALTAIELDGRAGLVAFLRDLRPHQLANDHAVLAAPIEDALDEADDAAIATVARTTRRFARSADPAETREAICTAAIEACDAAIAYLAEPDEDHGGLVVTAVAGAQLRDGVIVLPFDTPSAAIEAHRTGEPVFVADLATSPSPRARAQARALGSISGLVTPIARDGAGTCVLGITWEHRVGAAGRHTTVMRLLADEAALALARAEQLRVLEAQARTDPLTGLPNVRAWDEALSRELASSSRDGRPVCVAVTDLDDFKGYNDSRGHPAGDRLLRLAVAAWQQSLRAGDILARSGGDEFSVLLPNCRVEGAVVLAERLRTSTPLGRSCSVGVAAWDGKESAQELVARADRALYEAKASGRNRVIAQ